MPLIAVKDLEKKYLTDGVETPALLGVTFNIKRGEFIAIVGPSGSGKSTLLHILGFLDRQSGGTYEFDGKPMEEFSEEELAGVRNKKMGFVFQTFNLLARGSVLENVEMPLVYAGEEESARRAKAEKAIEAVGLSHRMEHISSQLSGGERQRVAVARALVNEPSVIFADEPTGNLDTASGRQVMEIIRELNEKHGHTIILVTHETYTANYAERIISILDGKVESDKKVTQRVTANNFRK